MCPRLFGGYVLFQQLGQYLALPFHFGLQEGDALLAGLDLLIRAGRPEGGGPGFRYSNRGLFAQPILVNNADSALSTGL